MIRFSDLVHYMLGKETQDLPFLKNAQELGKLIVAGLDFRDLSSLMKHKAHDIIDVGRKVSDVLALHMRQDAVHQEQVLYLTVRTLYLRCDLVCAYVDELDDRLSYFTGSLSVMRACEVHKWADCVIVSDSVVDQHLSQRVDYLVRLNVQIGVRVALLCLSLKTNV